MTAILAKVLAVHRQGGQYYVAIRIKFAGSFNALAFGKKKPFAGFCHDGRLELVYHQDPELEAGQELPLWTIQ
jgi:hypothetical protein